jgi:hypothetical protein
MVVVLAAVMLAASAMGSKCSGKDGGEPTSPPPETAATDESPADEGAVTPGEDTADRDPVQEPLEGGPFPAMLVVQSQFLKKAGKSVPGPARLGIVRKTDGGWDEVVVEDPESNVFHKAIAYTAPDGRKGIITIGAMQAKLKFWWWADGKWSSEQLWWVSFGGKFDRLRDIEIGDVDGDGKDEMVIATHDQGVIAVVNWDAAEAVVTEVDRTTDTFVHEIEIGDVDGDGKKEFFATPSKPNKVGQSQSGQVVRFDFDGTTYKKSLVESYDTRHVKEIMAADLDGDGKATLFAVVEAELSKVAGVTRIEKPVEIREFDFSGKQPTSRVIATIKDSQCRFLAWGDVEGDGTIELVAAAMKTGLWLMRPAEGGQWSAENFETDSSGYEHSTVFADLDGDKKFEIYVAADDQGKLERYVFKGGKLTKELVLDLQPDVITWNLMPARL